MATRFIPRLLGMVPVSWRQAVIGSGDRPSRLANFVHQVLNRAPVGKDEVFECKGLLRGFRMHTEWRRFRGFVYGNWEPEISAAITSAVQPGMTVLDIGGHIGYFTLLLAKYVGENGRVFAFEPLPENFELLQKNIRLNGLKRVEASQLAVFSKAGRMNITVADERHNSGESSLVHHVGSEQIQVEATTVDAFCEMRGIRPDFLKVDVEGAEYDVLMGAADTIRDSRPKLLIELHHFDGNVESNRVPNLLTQWGYGLEWIERSRQTSHILAIPGDE